MYLNSILIDYTVSFMEHYTINIYKIINNMELLFVNSKCVE